MNTTAGKWQENTCSRSTRENATMANLEQSALQASQPSMNVGQRVPTTFFYFEYLLNSLQCLFAQRSVFALSPSHAPGRTRGTAPLYLAGCLRAACVSVDRLHPRVRGDRSTHISKPYSHSKGCLQGTALSGTGGGGAVTGVRPITSSQRSLTWRIILHPTPTGQQT